MYKLFALIFSLSILVGCGAANTRAPAALHPSEQYVVKEDGVYWSRFNRLSQGQVELKVDSIDKATFSVLTQPLYAKDKNYVYYKATPIAQADVASFVVVNSTYSKDARNVYLSGEVIPGADPASFEVIAEGLLDHYARDRHNYFYGLMTMDACDRSSFSVVKGMVNSWSMDAKCAFHRGKKLAGADMASFKILEAGYATDAKRVYHLDQPVADADATSFVVKNGVASDKNHCYKTHLITPCDTKRSDVASLSLENIDKLAGDMAMSWVKSDVDKKREALGNIPSTARAATKLCQGSCLAPEDVKRIDLTKLPVGYLYTLKSNVPRSITDYYPRVDAINYKLRSARADQVEFDVIHPKNFGCLTETRLGSGKKTSAPLMMSAPFSREYYAPSNCEFEVGACQYVATVGKEGKPFTYTQIGSYSEGVWTYEVNTPTGKKMITTAVYDKMGLPLYESSFVENFLNYELIRGQ